MEVGKHILQADLCTLIGNMCQPSFKIKKMLSLGSAKYPTPLAEDTNFT